MQTPGTDSTLYPYLSDRVQSTFIDLFLVIIMMVVSGAALDSYQNVPDWFRGVLFIGIWAVYEPLLTCLGGTVGNRIKGIAVRRYKDTSRNINFAEACYRYVVKLSVGWISFVSIHFNEEKRAIHDLAAGSVMIRN